MVEKIKKSEGESLKLKRKEKKKRLQKNVEESPKEER